LQQRGPEGAFGALLSEIEREGRPDLPDSRTEQGDGMREWFATFADVLNEQWYSPQEFIPAGDFVVVPLRRGGYGQSSG
jgi:hypothetical protein